MSKVAFQQPEETPTFIGSNGQGGRSIANAPNHHSQWHDNGNGDGAVRLSAAQPNAKGSETMGYREDEKRWKRMMEMLTAESSGREPKPFASQKTLFGIPSSVELQIQQIVAEDEAARRKKRQSGAAGAGDAERQSGAAGAGGAVDADDASAAADAGDANGAGDAEQTCAPSAKGGGIAGTAERESAEASAKDDSGFPDRRKVTP